MNNIARPAGALIFTLGMLAGLTLAGVAIWGDLEAALFDSSIREEASLTTLSCPVIITAAEPAWVTASFTNPTDAPITLIARAHISRRYVTFIREVEQRLSLAPGETASLSWKVSAADAAYGRLVLVKVRSLRYYPLPAREGSCGIVVVNLPYVSGAQLVMLMIAISLSGLAAGLSLWMAANRSSRNPMPDETRAMGILASLVVAAMLTALPGWWLPGLLILALTLLLIGEMFRHIASR